MIIVYYQIYDINFKAISHKMNKHKKCTHIKVMWVHTLHVNDVPTSIWVHHLHVKYVLIYPNVPT